MLPSSGALFILWFNPRSLRNVNHPVYYKVLHLTISTAYFLYRDIIIGVWKTIVYTTTYFAFCIWNLFSYMLYFRISHYLPYFASILILNNQMFFFLDVIFFLYKIRKKNLKCWNWRRKNFMFECCVMFVIKLLNDTCIEICLTFIFSLSLESFFEIFFQSAIFKGTNLLCIYRWNSVFSSLFLLGGRL